MRITNPKFVKKANQWLVTIITPNNKGQDVCTRFWFGTYDEALIFKLEQEKKNEQVA